MENKVIIGNCLNVLPTLEAGSVQCCVTSPPYWGLRDYGHDGQIGLEKTPEEYVCKMIAVFSEVRRVLKDDGTLWLNLGDSYYNNFGGGSDTMSTGNAKAVKARGRSNKEKHDLYKIKDLCGIPWKVAQALQMPYKKCLGRNCGHVAHQSEWGFIPKHQKWSCPQCGRFGETRNVQDGWYLRSDIIWHKPNPMPESVTDRPTKAHEYLFLMAKSAKYYYDAEAIKEKANTPSTFHGGGSVDKSRNDSGRQNEGIDDGLKNKRSVWTVATKPYSEAHFATFPPDLVKPCILAGTRPGDLVLDPFSGSGTVGQVCAELARGYVGIELNSKYAELRAEERSVIGMGI